MRCLITASNNFKIDIFIKQVDFGIKKSATCKGFYQKLADTLLTAQTWEEFLAA